jgi:glucose-6-phosphate isomerase
MPKDNHSVMQLYLDGPKNNFFTFFHVSNKKSDKIINSKILDSHSHLKNKSLSEIIISQKLATEKVFLNKKIPFRSFEIINRNENALGELFCFFILETILIGRALKINPYDQPAVELIKKETKKILF